MGRPTLAIALPAMSIAVRGRICSSRAASSFAVAKPIGNPTDRLHQRWSALPVGTHLDLRSKRMWVCALRCLLWRSLDIPITPLAMALFGEVEIRDRRHAPPKSNSLLSS